MWLLYFELMIIRRLLSNFSTQIIRLKFKKLLDRIFDNAFFPDNGDFNFTRIAELLFDALG